MKIEIEVEIGERLVLAIGNFAAVVYDVMDLFAPSRPTVSAADEADDGGAAADDDETPTPRKALS